MRAKRGGLLRNAAIVAANTHADSLFPILTELVDGDSSGLVRRHALWASAIIASRTGEEAVAKVKLLLDTALQDGDLGVREECGMIRTQLRKFA